MKALTRIALAALLLLIATSSPMAGGDVEVSGQVRLRTQLAKKSFDTGAVWDQFSEMRTRIAMEAGVADNAHAYIQFQDSRVAGDTTSSWFGASGTTNSGNNVDIHQAYITIDNLFGEGWGAKGGRFEFTLGNQRLFGSVGWSNVGRSWEGIQFWYDQPKYKVTPFWLKKAELRSSSYNRDFDLLGIVVDVKDLNWQTFVVLEKNADSAFHIGPPTNPDILQMSSNALNRLTIGTYYKRKHEAFDFELNAALQSGDVSEAWMANAGADTITQTLDISAMMVAFEAGYTFNPEKGCRVAAGFDYTSGHSLTDSAETGLFSNLYYTGHKFRGYMDYFVAGPDVGVMDLMLRGKTQPMDGWTANIDFHLFTAAEDYQLISMTSATASDTVITKDLGMEIDLVVSTTRVEGVTLVAGASYFIAKDNYARALYEQQYSGVAFASRPGFEKDPGMWLWGMTVVNF